jgi:ankyrin repeat protein
VREIANKKRSMRIELKHEPLEPCRIKNVVCCHRKEKAKRAREKTGIGGGASGAQKLQAKAAQEAAIKEEIERQAKLDFALTDFRDKAAVGAVVTSSAWWYPVVLRAFDNDLVKWATTRAILIGLSEEENERKRLLAEAKEKARVEAEEKAREEAEERAAEAEGVGSAAAGAGGATADGKDAAAVESAPLATAGEGGAKNAKSVAIVMIDVDSSEEHPAPADEAEDVDYDGTSLSVEQQCSLLLWAALQSGYKTATTTLANVLGGLTPNDGNLHFDIRPSTTASDGSGSLSSDDVTLLNVTFCASFHAFKAASLFGVGEGLPPALQQIVRAMAVPQSPYPSAMCTTLLGPSAPLLGIAARNALLCAVPASETPVDSEDNAGDGVADVMDGQGVGVRGLLEASRGGNGSGSDTEAVEAVTIIDSTAGRTPLHLLCSRVTLQPSMAAQRLSQVAQFLAVSPASATVCDAYGRFPIHFAAGLRRPPSVVTIQRLASHRPRAPVEGSACHRALMVAADKLVAAAALLDPDAEDGVGPTRKKLRKARGKKAKKAKKAAEKAKQEAEVKAAAETAAEAAASGVGGHVVIKRGWKEQERVDRLEASAAAGMSALSPPGGRLGADRGFSTVIGAQLFTGGVGDGMTLAEVGGPMVRLMATVVLLLLDHQLGPEDSDAIAQAVAEEEGLIKPMPTPTEEVGMAPGTADRRSSRSKRSSTSRGGKRNSSLSPGPSSRKASGTNEFPTDLPNQSEATQVTASWPAGHSPAQWSWPAVRERLFGRPRRFLRWLRCFDPTILTPEKMRALAPWLPGASSVKALAGFNGGQNVTKMEALIMEGGAAAAEKHRLRMACAEAAADVSPEPTPEDTEPAAPPPHPLRAFFDGLDINADGTLTKTELVKALKFRENEFYKLVGINERTTSKGKSRCVDRFFEEANNDGDTTLNFEEFVAAVEALEREAKLEEAVAETPLAAVAAATSAKAGEPPQSAEVAVARADGAAADTNAEGSTHAPLQPPLIKSPRVIAPPSPDGFSQVSHASVLLATASSPPREEYGPEWCDYGTVMSELVGWLQQVGKLYPPWRVHWMEQREKKEKESRMLMAAERRRRRREAAQKKADERKAKENGERDVGKAATGPKRGRREQAQQEKEDDGDRASKEAEMLRLTLRAAVATEGTMLRTGLIAQQIAQEYGLDDAEDENEDEIVRRNRELHTQANNDVSAAVAEAAAAATVAAKAALEADEPVPVMVPEELRLVKFEGSPEEAEEAEEDNAQSLVMTGPTPPGTLFPTVAGSGLPVASNGYISVVHGAKDVDRRIMGGYGPDPVHHEHHDAHLPPPEHDGTHGKRAAIGGALDGAAVYLPGPWGPLGPIGGLEMQEETAAYRALDRSADLLLLRLLIGGDKERAETLKVADQLGQQPLHLACAAYDPDPDIIGTLVQVYPLALKVADKLERLPVHRVAVCPKPTYRSVQAIRLLLRADVDLQYQEIDHQVELRAIAVETRKEARKKKREEDLLARKELEKDPNTPYMGKKAKAALAAQIQAEQDAEDAREAAVEAQLVSEEETIRAAVVPWSVAQPDEQSALPLHLALDKPLGSENRNAELVAMTILEAWPAAAEETDGFDRWTAPAPGEVGDDGLGGDEWERCPVTPLNLALLRGASPSLIRALVLAYPPAVGQGDFLKRLPIHYACRFNPNLEVVRLLQEVYPVGAKKVDGKRRLPLHLAVDANGGACTPYTRFTPPRYFTMAGSMSGAANAGVGVVRLLLRAFRDGTKKAEGTKRYYPLSIACVQPNAQAAVVKLLLERDTIGPTESARRVINDGSGTMAVHQLSEQLYPNEDVLSLMIQAYPRSAKEADSKRWLPLHYAVTTNLASGLVRLLLQSNPEAAERKVLYQGTHSCNPLHICMRRQQPPLAICQQLLEFYPDGAREADGSGWLPIHFMCAKPDPEVGVIKALLNVMPQVMPLKGALMLPLHMICAKPLDPNLVNIIRELLRAHKDGAKVADADGMFPIHLVCAQRKNPATGNAGPNAEAVSLLLEAFPKAATKANQNGLLPLHQICAAEEPSVPVAKLLLRAYKGAAGQTLPGKVLPIHQVVAQQLPNNDLLRLLIEAFPKAVERPDGDGMLALHVLCLTPPLVPSSEAVALLEQRLQQGQPSVAPQKKKTRKRKNRGGQPQRLTAKMYSATLHGQHPYPTDERTFRRERASAECFDNTTSFNSAGLFPGGDGNDDDSDDGIGANDAGNGGGDGGTGSSTAKADVTSGGTKLPAIGSATGRPGTTSKAEQCTTWQLPESSVTALLRTSRSAPAGQLVAYPGGAAPRVGGSNLNWRTVDPGEWLLGKNDKDLAKVEREEKRARIKENREKKREAAKIARLKAEAMRRGDYTAALDIGKEEDEDEMGRPMTGESYRDGSDDEEDMTNDMRPLTGDSGTTMASTVRAVSAIASMAGSAGVSFVDAAAIAEAVARIPNPHLAKVAEVDAITDFDSGRLDAIQRAAGQLLDAMEGLLYSSHTILLSQEPTNGMTALHIACDHRPGALHVVEQLIHVDPSAASLVDDAGMLPLHYACDKGRAHAGLDVHGDNSQIGDGGQDDAPADDISSKGGQGPKVFKRADQPYVAACSLAVCRAVVLADSSACKVQDKQGRLPLHWACDQSHPEPLLVALLLDKYPGAVQVRDKDGMVPLHLACGKQKPNAAVLKALLTCSRDGTRYLEAHSLNCALPTLLILFVLVRFLQGF